MVTHKITNLLTSKEMEIIFQELVNKWQEETRGISSSTELILHPAYQQIIGMGEPIIPLLAVK